MIEVVSSSPVHDTVEEALEAIVEHFSDPIHRDLQEALPYFHDDDTTNATSCSQLSPVLQHWMNRLEHDDTDRVKTTLKLSQGYTEYIRPTLLHRKIAGADPVLSPTGISVLRHYEVLLANFLEDVQTTKTNTSSKYLNDSSLECHHLEALATDISHVTKLAVQQKEKEMEEDAQLVDAESPPSWNEIVNIVLPTMVQVLVHSFNVLNLLDALDCTSEAVQKCMVVMLAFDDNPHVDPRKMAPWLERTLFIFEKDPTFCYIPCLVPTESQNDSIMMNLGSHLSSDDEFWGKLRVDGSSWQDPETGILRKVAERFWRSLYQQNFQTFVSRKKSAENLIVEVKEQSESTPTDLEVGTDHNTSNSRPIDDIIHHCLLQNISSLGIAKVVRSHFFGRDTFNLPETKLVAASQSTVRTRLHLGRSVTVSKEDSMDSFSKTFLEVPSRVHVAMRYMSLLQTQDLAGRGNAQILEEVLPIIYELLSATTACHIAVGAAALIHLVWLSRLTNDTISTELVAGASSQEYIFATYLGTLLPVLNMACLTCRDGPPFALLARAQSMLCWSASSLACKSIPASVQETMLKHRRATTREFLTVLDKHSHKVSDPDGLLWALLVGGVIPLLQQHATVKEASRTVDGMELGRLGLAALLPILRYSSGWSMDNSLDEKIPNTNKSRKLLAPTVLALVHLLHVSFPIMPRHGGKIMSELMALLGNLQKQQLAKSEQHLMDLVQDAAAIALVICGERAAQVFDIIISQAQDSASSFDVCFCQMAREVQGRATKWREAQTPLARHGILF